MKSVLPALLLFGLATSVQADGHADPAAGEAGFKKCQACHVVKDADGNVLAGKTGRIGPNLFGIVGRQAGTVEKFRYKKSIVAAGEAGLVDIGLNPRDVYTDTMTEAQDPLYRTIIDSLPEGRSLRDYITSVEVTARRAAR